MERARNLTMLISRVLVGVIFILHGLIKVTNLEASIAGFATYGVPLPTLSVWFAFLVEIIGGVAFIIGYATPVVGVLFALVTTGAMVFVHAENGFFAGKNGIEYVLVLAVVSVGIGFNPGTIGVGLSKKREPVRR
jgi:putative oxidoreductase